MNWGKGLTVAMICFMSFIGILITLIMSNHVDLVSEDYYKQEIVYGDEIVALNNWRSSFDTVAISTSESHLVLVLPNIAGAKEFELSLRRPNDMADDQHFRFSETHTFLIDRKKLKKGQYDFRISTLVGKKKYLTSGQYYVK